MGERSRTELGIDYRGPVRPVPEGVRLSPIELHVENLEAFEKNLALAVAPAVKAEPKDRTHHHDHGHSHEPAGVAQATYEPGKKLSREERFERLKEAGRWSRLAAVALILDAIFHAIPGTADDVVFHGMAAVFLAAAGRGFNSFWRGHDMPGSEVNVNKIWSDLWASWKRNGIRRFPMFLTEGAAILHDNVPQPVEREPYRGEGNPVSSVTYARENLFYNRYAETDGPLKGWRKRAFSIGVLVSTAVSYTVGSALREAIINNLHETNEWTEKWLRLRRGTWANSIASFALATIQAPFRAAYGLIDGGYRYENEFRAGKKGKNHLEQPVTLTMRAS